MTTLFKYLRIPVIVLVATALFSCYGKKQIIVDQSLAAHSERWEADVKFLGARRVSFGPFATSRFSKLDSPTYKTNTFKPFRWNVPPEDVVTKKKWFEIRLSLGADTAEAMVSVITINKSINSTRKEGRKVVDDITLGERKMADGVISVNDKFWSFNIGPYCDNPRLNPDFGVLTTGRLANEQDHISFSIEPVNDFTAGGSPVLKSKGISLKNSSGEPIAALQLVGQNFIWIKNELAPTTRLAIAVLFAAVLNTQKTL